MTAHTNDDHWAPGTLLVCDIGDVPDDMTPPGKRVLDSVAQRWENWREDV